MYDLADGILVEYTYLTMKVVNVLVEEVLPRGGGRVGIDGVSSKEEFHVQVSI